MPSSISVLFPFPFCVDEELDSFIRDPTDWRLIVFSWFPHILAETISPIVRGGRAEPEESRTKRGR